MLLRRSAPEAYAEEYDISIVVISICSGILIFLLILGGTARTKKKEEGDKVFSRCPLCGKGLKKGERILSDAFPGNTDGRIIHIKGCPYCYGKGALFSGRKCPVCKINLSETGYCTGKMWEDKGKIRVHILGCEHCRNGQPA